MKTETQNDYEFEKQLHDAFYEAYFNYIPYDDEKLFALIEKAQDGDKEARDKIWLANLSLIPNIVKKLDWGDGVELDDLIQEGALGVYHSILCFDTKSGYKFSTYTFQAIRSHVLRYKQSLNKYKMPRSMNANIWIYKKSVNTNPDLTDTERYKTLKHHQGFESFERYLQVKMFSNVQFVSLNAPVISSENKELLELQDFLPDDFNLEEEIIQKLLFENTVEVLKQLSDREIEVIEKRMGLITGKPETLQEIADKFNLSRERVRQIELKAIKKMKRMMKIT